MALPPDRGGLGWGTALVTGLWSAAIVLVVAYLAITGRDDEQDASPR